VILQRLYELAEREKLLDDPAVVTTPVACRVDIDRDGKFLGLHDLRERREIGGGRKRPPRIVLSGGKILPVPVRPVLWDEKRGAWKTTDPAASGKEKPAVFLADTVARVLPVDRLILNADPRKEEQERAKFRAQRSTFWRFLQYAAEQTVDEALRSMAAFAGKVDGSLELRDEIAREVERLGLGLTGLCTFALNEDRGRTVLEREQIQGWWRSFFAHDLQSQQEGQFRGLCQVTGEVTALSETVKSRISGLVPIGCRAEAYLVTGLGSAESYHLPGAISGMVSARGIDGFTRALNTLIEGSLAGRPSRYRIGGVVFLFWTKQPVDTGVMNLFDPDSAQVEALLNSVQRGQESLALEDANSFYLLTLSGNSARVVVRDYLETRLPRLVENLRRWFTDLRIADATRDGGGHPTSMFPLWQLAQATALDADQVAPDTSARLMTAALTAGSVPESLLTACLRRLRAEEKDKRDKFRPVRMALIKLILTRMEVPVTETLNSEERHPAYVYGRLLSVFEQIQYAALGDVNANVVDKFYGTFSAAPGLVFSRLHDNARNHLRKLRGVNERAYLALDRALTEVSALLPPARPKSVLSLQEQGLFALGYYHQKAKRFEQIAEKRAKTSNLPEPTATVDSTDQPPSA
jgi:CRISPR-associated protein Csd1